MTNPDSPPTFPNALETLDRHWAVKVVTPEDRAAAIQFGMRVLSHLGNGALGETEPAPDYVVPLAGAYVIAASEWLDFEGAASPSVLLSAEQEAQRTAHIQAGADRAFILTAALPLEPDERIAALYRTLLLAGLAELSHKHVEFRHWLRAHDDLLFPPVDANAPWDIVLLRRVVELWVDVLRGAGPSGLDRAMELVAKSVPFASPRFSPALTRPTKRACASSCSRCSISPKQPPSCCCFACTVSPSASTCGCIRTSRSPVMRRVEIHVSTPASTGCTKRPGASLLSVPRSSSCCPAAGIEQTLITGKSAERSLQAFVDRSASARRPR